jgi:hypothetical protein
MKSGEGSRTQSDLGPAENERERAFGAVEEERISLGDPQQIREWATKLGITPEHLRELVAQVGPRVCDLKQRLSQPELVD